MENEKNKQQSSGGEQPSSAGQNPTLGEPGTQVADYGNVTGGSADGRVEQSKGENNNENRAGDADTEGNP